MLISFVDVSRLKTEVKLLNSLVIRQLTPTVRHRAKSLERLYSLFKFMCYGDKLLDTRSQTSLS